MLSALEKKDNPFFLPLVQSQPHVELSTRLMIPNAFHYRSSNKGCEVFAIQAALTLGSCWFLNNHLEVYEPLSWPPQALSLVPISTAAAPPPALAATLCLTHPSPRP